MPEQLISDHAMRIAKVFVSQAISVARMEAAAERNHLRGLIARQELRVRAELRKAASPRVNPTPVEHFRIDELLAMTDEEMQVFQQLLTHVRQSRRDAGVGPLELDDVDRRMDETFVFMHGHSASE